MKDNTTNNLTPSKPRHALIEELQINQEQTDQIRLGTTDFSMQLVRGEGLANVNSINLSLRSNPATQPLKSEWLSGLLRNTDPDCKSIHIFSCE